jgi:hypothetical protein
MKQESHENNNWGEKAWGEEGKRKNLPSVPNNHTTGGKKPHKGGTFFLPREKQELLSQVVTQIIN